MTTKVATIIGKDCPMNIKALEKFIQNEGHHYIDTEFLVGVESFEDVLLTYGHEVCLYERTSDDASDLCCRLMELLDTDEVLVLPTVGRMTKVERDMALEAGIPVRVIPCWYWDPEKLGES